MPNVPSVSSISTSEKPGASGSSLRILSIAPTSFFSDYGCHVRILEEARTLKALGHDVTIVTYFKGTNTPGFRIIRTMPTPWHGNYEVGSSRHKFAFDILLGIRLLRVMARNGFDVIHAHLHEGALLGSVLTRPWHIPVCFDYQGSLTSEMLDHGFLHRDTRLLGMWQQLERVIERMPAAIFTSTLGAAEVLRQRISPASKVHTLLDGVNTDTFYPGILSADERATHRTAYGWMLDDPVVVYLGLLAVHQGIGSLIEVAARLKNEGRQIRWLVMGYPGVSDWQRLARENDLEKDMVFTGRVPYSNAPRMLALGDIAIAPKLSQTEGSGKILNYMAMGLPTVAFETPAQKEYLGNLGVYAPVGDTEALARRIVDLLDHPAQRGELGNRLRQRALQQFGWDQVGLQIDSVYRELLVPQRRAMYKRDSHMRNPSG